MKRTFFIIILVLLGVQLASGQCVVYVCNNTCHFGYAWNDDPHKLFSIYELKEAADKKCQENGGTDCALTFSNENPGWYGIVKYKTSDDVIHIGLTALQASQTEAESELSRIINKYDGAEALFRRTFRVYSNKK